MELWAEISTTGTHRSFRMEREFATDVEDLWSAVTDLERVRRWLWSVEREGDDVILGFDGGHTRNARIVACDAPRLLHLTIAQDDDVDSQLVASLESTLGGSRLVLTQDGLPEPYAALFTSGWHRHVAKLAREAGEKDVVVPELADVLPMYEANAAGDEAISRSRA